MRTLSISKAIATYLSGKLDIKKIKATPEAIFAPDSYDMVEPGAVILIWLDSVPAYTDSAPRSELGLPNPNAHLKKNLRFCVSVGYRSADSAPDLDGIVEDIEELLTNYDIDEIAPLRPSGIGKMTINTNMIYWRQMWFDTIYKLTVPVHS